MLYLRQVKHLARHLGVTVGFLERVTDQKTNYCEELELIDPSKPEKARRVLNIVGPYRELQDKMLRSLLLRKLQFSPYSHGGIPGKDIKSNVVAHANSNFAFATDIANFYPSVSHNRVYRLFNEKLGCTPDVAKLCTELCTVKYHLALGLPTSPILAVQILRAVDRRIGAACMKEGLVYTRFVDDLTISSPFDLEQNCGIPALVQRILNECGFGINPNKNRYGKLANEFVITGIRIRKGRLDVRRKYLEELVRQIEDARRLAYGGEFQGPYFTQAQITGRVRFVTWINRGRMRQLRPKIRSIPWGRVELEARKRGLIATQKKLQSLSKSPASPNTNKGGDQSLKH